jgi:mRNA-degrading endonuclease toxin of MazEF toxin-antitoxin module
MGKPVIGEVVVLPFPQTDLQVGKRRPALVVADLAGDDLILCQITTQSRRDPYSVSLASSDLESGRLNVDSFIRPNRLFTVDHAVIIYSVAKVKYSKLDEARAKIRQLFS